MRAAPPTSQMDWRTWAFHGMQYRPPIKRSHWRRTVKAVMAYMMLTVVASLVAGLVTLIYGIGIVAPDILDNPDWQDGYPLFIVLPVFVDLITISGYALLTYYLLIAAAIVAACCWVFLSSYKDFYKELTLTAEARRHSQIFDISGMIFLDMFGLIVAALLAILFGVSDTDTGETGVTGTTSELLFGLANASVWEELIVRVLMIGLPLLLVDLFIRKEHGKLRKYILGGGFSFGTVEIVLLVVSAAIFGYAHYLGGWEAWVVPWDALVGLAFGYLFLRHGLAAAIVLHFAIDYRSMPSLVFDFSQAFELVLFMLWMALGAIFAVYYVSRVAEFLTGKRYLEEHPPRSAIYPPRPVAQYAASQQPMPPVSPGETVSSQKGSTMYPPPQLQNAQFGGYVCPYCGHTEARWVDGKFLCLKCGRLA